MSAGAIRAGKAFVELSIKDSLDKGLNAAKARMQAWGAGLMAVGGVATAMGTSVMAVLGHDVPGRRLHVTARDGHERVRRARIVVIQMERQLVRTGSERDGLLVLDEWSWTWRARAARALCARAADEEAEPHHRPRDGPDCA